MITFDYVIRQNDLIRPAVGIDVLDTQEIRDNVDVLFRQKLWDSQTYHGILFSRQQVRIYEHLLPYEGADAYKAKEASTLDVLRTVSRFDLKPDLDPDMDSEHYRRLVRRWIELLVGDWSASIPPASKWEFMGLVPAAAEGDLCVAAEVEDLTR
jgi:hypothetical protein